MTLRAQILNEATTQIHLIVPSDDAQRVTAQWLNTMYAECARDIQKQQCPNGSGADTKAQHLKLGHSFESQSCPVFDVDWMSINRVRRVHVSPTLQGSVITRMWQAATSPNDMFATTRIAQYTPLALTLILIDRYRAGYHG